MIVAIFVLALFNLLILLLGLVSGEQGLMAISGLITFPIMLAVSVLSLLQLVL